MEKTVVLLRGGFGFDSGPAPGPPASKMHDLTLSLKFLDNLMDGKRVEKNVSCCSNAQPRWLRCNVFTAMEDANTCRFSGVDGCKIPVVKW